MEEKTKITISLLKLMGFDKLGTDDTYVNAKTNMVVEFSSNIPIIRRYISRGNHEYIGGYEFYEDALEAFDKVVLPTLVPDGELDLKMLRSCCEGYIDMVVNDKYGQEDAKHYIYEEAIKAMYGKDIFNFINKHCR